MVKSLATVGVAPVQKGVPAQLETVIANVTHGAFINGMTASFLVACAVAVAGALIALLTRRATAPPANARGPRAGQDRTHGH